MPEVDFDWVRAQMDQAKVKVGSGKMVLKLLETWDGTGLSAAAAKEAIDLFSKLALTHALIEENPDEVWVPAQPGFLKVADEVRVRQDAYDGSLGVIHNGRRGKITAIRYGDVVIRSTDGKEPFLDGTHYTPYLLEKRIR